MKLYVKVAYVETFYEDFIELESYPSVLGRGPGNQITLMGHEVSRRHAEIFERDGKLYLRDLGSRTGLWHAGKVLTEIEVTEGLQLRIGSAVLTFSFVHFPLEQTISYGHEEEPVHHEPVMKRIELALHGKLALILFLILLALAFMTAPDLYRKTDYFKNLISSLITKSFVSPLLLTVFIVLFRKVNRGEYSWNRSLCMSFVLCITGQLVSLVEGSFCWFNIFSLIWNSIPVSILLTGALIFWWFLAVGKSAGLKGRIFRSLGLATIVYSVIFVVQLLSTGYKSDYEIESCDSLTGWHWGPGKDLNYFEKYLVQSAKELAQP